ncbi:dolichol-phosphate mannosyltransferase subunit 3 [Tribolium castaneum]|uniref:Dolichol-phosphate mannosyltransferase subunit 3 n=1 Tax=Tribolium castaneum TaxID=7070 RepID=D2A440_TRICA|nr:PREDICTED: dolichol-phosphate mannosyltransferase subunit 3 [Tribolium castaneum]EFA04846.1 Dolichol-phosphate mannosyltransferase subunit 3-like Protein [Tribolium castaneum]|eukprot:XP_008195004.1 PREDICTED: dolichol-phosphate mannosyltransferase subunit 3 [Tribolium castaneum]
MTKLLEWVAVLGALGAVWLSLVTNTVEFGFVRQYPTAVFYSPVIFVGLFGIYAIIVVLYRVFTFNDCEKAAAELQEEIVEARADLAKLGFRFK